MVANQKAITIGCRKERYIMVIQPLKVSGVQFATNTNKQPKTNSQRVKQTLYKPTFSDFLKDLMMEQREQM